VAPVGSNSNGAVVVADKQGRDGWMVENKLSEASVVSHLVRFFHFSPFFPAKFVFRERERNSYRTILDAEAYHHITYHFLSFWITLSEEVLLRSTNFSPLFSSFSFDSPLGTSDMKKSEFRVIRDTVIRAAWPDRLHQIRWATEFEQPENLRKMKVIQRKNGALPLLFSEVEGFFVIFFKESLIT